MNAIVAVCDDWGIGHEGSLLVRNRADMHRFVELTMGGTVLMGRTTFQGFPGGALKGRRNVVLTRQEGWEAPGVEVARTVEEALELVAPDEPRVWLIGGASVYRELLPRCQRAYVTVNHVTRPADAFFPNLDQDPAWQVEAREEGGTTKSGIPFEFVTYVRG